jgi:hypothetical protein
MKQKPAISVILRRGARKSAAKTCDMRVLFRRRAGVRFRRRDESETRTLAGFGVAILGLLDSGIETRILVMDLASRFLGFSFRKGNADPDYGSVSRFEKCWALGRVTVLAFVGTGTQRTCASQGLGRRGLLFRSVLGYRLVSTWKWDVEGRYVDPSCCCRRRRASWNRFVVGEIETFGLVVTTGGTQQFRTSLRLLICEIIGHKSRYSIPTVENSENNR